MYIIDLNREDGNYWRLRSFCPCCTQWATIQFAFRPHQAAMAAEIDKAMEVILDADRLTSPQQLIFWEMLNPNG